MGGEQSFAAQDMNVGQTQEAVMQSEASRTQRT